ncbi:MAG: helix-turn-helix transcriptional regulator [Phycisphaerales bacterium]
MPRARFRIENNIRALRFAHDEMTQQALADRIGVSRQTVNAIEGGKYSPTLEVAFQIAEVFEKPLEEVFTFRRVTR